MNHPLVLHIGPLKTGTTYLQAGLQQHREHLKELGWLYPGVEKDLNQERAFFGLLGEQIEWVTAAEKLKRSAAAERLITETAAWDGPLIVSAEALSVLTSEGAQNAVDLFPDRPVRVIVTARDLGRVIPSHLTQLYKTGRAESAAHLMKRITRERENGSWFWRMYDYPALVERWAALDRVVDIKFVTLPARSGQSELLWDRFLEAAAMDLPERLTPPVVGPAERNLSLTAPEARFIRALNLEMQDLEKPQEFIKGVLGPVLHEGLAVRPKNSRGENLTIPMAWVDNVRTWAADDSAKLDAMTDRVIGDLADLEPVIRESSDPEEDGSQLRPGEEDVVSAAVAGIIAMYEVLTTIEPYIPPPPLTIPQRLKRKTRYLLNGRKLPETKRVPSGRG